LSGGTISVPPGAGRLAGGAELPRPEGEAADDGGAPEDEDSDDDVQPATRSATAAVAAASSDGIERIANSGTVR
jgi:hypothetical protein